MKHITLIGMSNIGKSATSVRLRDEHGFLRIDCDDEVNQVIPRAVALAEAGLKLNSVEDCAAWMGQPGRDNPDYEARSAIFVESEREVMLGVINRLQDLAEKRVVIDTCGSVIYTGDAVLGRLKAMTHVVYLAATKEYQKQLFENYIAAPKPVVWPSGIFSQAAGQSKHDALAEGYPKLLASRDARYRAMADTIIEFEIHRNRRADLTGMLGLAG